MSTDPLDMTEQEEQAYSDLWDSDEEHMRAIERRLRQARLDGAWLIKYRRIGKEVADAYTAIAAVTKDDTVAPDVWVAMLERATAANQTIIDLVKEDGGL